MECSYCILWFLSTGAYWDIRNKLDNSVLKGDGCLKPENNIYQKNDTGTKHQCMVHGCCYVIDMTSGSQLKVYGVCLESRSSITLL